MNPDQDLHALRATLEDAWERRTELGADDIAARVRPAVDAAIAGLESGELRVAEPDGNGGWQVNQWLKKAVLLYFRTQDMQVVDAAPAPFWDKVSARFAGFDEAAFRQLGARVVRHGSTDIAVFRNGEDEIFALEDRCPHKGGPLSQGIVSGKVVTCPLHSWKIDLETGEAVAPDVGCTPPFSVKRVGDEVWIAL